MRRFAYRTDGFVALRGGPGGGRATTKLLNHSGRQLLLNYVVADGGSLMLEALDSAGKTIGRSKPLSGDAVDATVDWALEPTLKGESVRLRFSIKNADVYSLRFD